MTTECLLFLSWVVILAGGLAMISVSAIQYLYTRRRKPEPPDFCPHGVIPPDDCPTCRH